MIRDSIVGIVTRLQAGQLKNHGSIPCKGTRFFSKSKYPDQLYGPFNVLVNEYKGQEPNHPPICSAQAENEWNYNSIIPYAFSIYKQTNYPT